MSRFSFASQFQRQHLWYPLLGLVLLIALLELGGFDLWLADRLYALEGGSWRWRDAWLTSTLIHAGGRALVAVMALALLVFSGMALSMARWRPWRSGLGFLLCATFGAGLLINLLKHLTHMDCPWDLLRYGGSKVYVPLFSVSESSQAPGVCFPAGHASAAYAWCGWYYWCLRHAPRWRWLALGLVLTLGAVFGFGQQLRGAHFMSHDVWTLGLCWGFATTLYLFWYPTGQGVSAKQENCAEPVQLL